MFLLDFVRSIRNTTFQCLKFHQVFYCNFVRSLLSANRTFQLAIVGSSRKALDFSFSCWYWGMSLISILVLAFDISKYPFEIGFVPPTCLQCAYVIILGKLRVSMLGGEAWDWTRPSYSFTMWLGYNSRKIESLDALRGSEYNLDPI